MILFAHAFLSGYEYVIIVVYVDDLNIIETPGELPKAIECLKREFEMKDLGKTKFCLGYKIEHLKDEILVHQEAYIGKLLKRFYMDKSHSLSTPMVVRTLDVKKDPFRPRDIYEEILGPEIPYLKNEAPIVLYEDNAACIAQLKEGYIKGDRTKHILPAFLFTHNLQKNGDIIVQQVRSSDNLADLFTKALPTLTFRKLSHNIGMRQLNDLK
ncbi:retrovirus-related pol polyprotein from transposon TNT 1-94 [Tanacetum coccineum]|uniref:Retrovirus-related pol polyprotein from transposon TNT 1-94 n=1 Tax=Tanacetum coccineum TaxID=301880 RepID=A0ABQ5AIG7_9ASTR